MAIHAKVGQKVITLGKDLNRVFKFVFCNCKILNTTFLLIELHVTLAQNN